MPWARATCETGTNTAPSCPPVARHPRKQRARLPWLSRPTTREFDPPSQQRGSPMTAHSTSPTPASVAARVAALPYLSMDDLWALWDDHFDEQPNHHHRVWLESRLAYRISGAISRWLWQQPYATARYWPPSRRDGSVFNRRTLNANLLRRWVTEHERYGHHGGDITAATQPAISQCRPASPARALTTNVG